MKKEEIMMNHCSDNGLLSMAMGKSILKAMDEYAEQQLKNCNLQNVSQQRELLFAFGKYLQKRNVSDFTPQMFIDDFLSEQ